MFLQQKPAPSWLLRKIVIVEMVGILKSRKHPMVSMIWSMIPPLARSGEHHPLLLIVIATATVILPLTMIVHSRTIKVPAVRDLHQWWWPNSLLQLPLISQDGDFLPLKVFLEILPHWWMLRVALISQDPPLTNFPVAVAVAVTPTTSLRLRLKSFFRQKLTKIF